MKVYLPILSYFFLLISSYAQLPVKDPDQRYFVHLQARTVEERTEVANFIHPDQMVEDSIYAVVNEFDLQQLQKHLPDLLLESHPLPLPTTKAKADDSYEFPSADQKYHTYAEVHDELVSLHAQYPNLTSLFSIGQSVEGREIWGIRITAPSNCQSSFVTPGILYVGAHHAREHLSTEIPMELIKYVLQNANDGRIGKLIANRDIYIIPMLNPDGAMYDIKGRQYKMWRKNRSNNRDGSAGVDLNRNYSYGWGTGGSSTSPSSDVYMGPQPFSEPETLSLKKFIEANAHIRVILSFHTFSELILYPWGGKDEGVGGKDQQVFTQAAQTMSQWNNYTPEQASDLYIASGDTCDWAYGEQGIFCFTFELSPKSGWFGGGFYPGAQIIDKVFTANLEPALYLMELSDDPYKILK